jgi:hypothetical protein
MGECAVSVDGIRFPVLRAGPNSVAVVARNHSDVKRTVAIHVQSYGYLGGFGIPYFRDLSPFEEAEWIIEFELRGDPNELTWVRLRYYDLPSGDGYRFEEYCCEDWFRGPDLERYQPPEGVHSDRIPSILREEALAFALSKMVRHRTANFDVYCSLGSTACAELDRIADMRDRSIEAVARWLGLSEYPRIRLILFEDGTEKRRRTGHQGEGFAYGATIVEVYNSSVRLDPAHEVTHILAEQIGCPPALLREGLATYMPEALGSRPLSYAELGVYERCGEILRNGDWIPLSRLLSFTEIGPAESTPAVSYPEAGAFVRYVVEEFGRHRLLQLYTSLRNPAKGQQDTANRALLESIFGVTIGTLEGGWRRRILSQS